MKKSFLVFLLLVSIVIYGQENSPTPSYQQFVPVSPSAAALSKEVNYPVNYNTGVPNISIPFHEVSVGNLKIPIGLNYHAAGFKINEKSTRVGLGWSLSSDLQITRSINGKSDFNGFDTSVSFNNTNGQLKEQFYDLYFNSKDAMPDKFNYKLLNKSGSFYLKRSGIDSTSTYKAFTVPYDNIKITYSSGFFTIIDTDGTTYYFGTTGDVAGQNLEEGLEKAKREYTNGEVTTWKCDKIIGNNNKDKIFFEYERKAKDVRISYTEKLEYYDNPNPCSVIWKKNYRIYGVNSEEIKDANGKYSDLTIPTYLISSPKYIKYFPHKTELHIPYFDENYYLKDKVLTDDFTTNGARSRSVIHGLSLKKISYRGGEITFEGADQLKNIKIKDSDGNLVKSLKLEHDNAQTYVDGKLTEGTLYLEAIEDNALQKHTFNYNEKFNFGSHLKGHDIWGFANKYTRTYSDNSPLGIPELTVNQKQFYDMVRIPSCQEPLQNDVTIKLNENDLWFEYPDAKFLKYGVLSQINYPTGASVFFDFEPNQYKEYFTSKKVEGNQYTEKVPQYAGGLRIKSITKVMSNSREQKYYRYGDLEDGTGFLMQNPHRTDKEDSYNFAIESYQQTDYYYLVPSGSAQYPYNACKSPSCLDELLRENKTTYQSASYLDYTYANGSLVYYTKVTEYQKDLGKETGKTVYTYYPVNEYFGDSMDYNDRILIPNTNIPYLKNHWMIGAQKTIEQYKYNAKNKFELVHKKSFEYDRYESNSLDVCSVFLKQTHTILNGNPQEISNRQLYDHFFHEGAYEYALYRLQLGKLLLKKETDIVYEGSNNITTSTRYTYGKLPYLQPSKTTTTKANGVNIETEFKYAYNYTGASDVDAVYQGMKDKNMISQLVATSTKKNGKKLSGTKINYQFFNKDNGNGFYKPVTIEKSIKEEPFTTDITFDYDIYGNIIELKGKDNVPTSYIWGYNKLYPVAELKNILYSSIPDSYKDKATLDSFDLKSLREEYKDSDNQLVTTFTHRNQVGVTSITNANGLSTSYNYDNIGRLTEVMDSEGNVIQSNKYHVTNHNEMEPGLTYESPKMRTIDYSSETGFVNAIVNGGRNLYDVSVKYKLLALEGSVQNPFSYSDLESEGLASIELEYTFQDYSGSYYTYQGDPIENENGVYVAVAHHPTSMELDFLQDNSIVATQKFNPISDNPPPGSVYESPPNTTLLVPAGDYQLSFRMPARVHYDQGFIPNFSIAQCEDLENKQKISSGDTFTFQKGKKYKIIATNY